MWYAADPGGSEGWSMPDQYKPSDRDDHWFAEHCKADAERFRPAFSEAVHRKVMAAVLAGEKNDLPHPTSGHCGPHRVRMAAAVAAVFLILPAGAGGYPGPQTQVAPASQQVAALTTA